MYEVIDEWVHCGKHGRIHGAIHLYVEDGDPDNPEHCWLVCLDCARRLDSDPTFRASERAAFEEYQRHLREYLKEKRNAK